jgi:hypothetical protein
MRLASRPLFASVISTLALTALLCTGPAAKSMRSRLPEHRIGPLAPGMTTEKVAVERLGPGLQFPGNRSKGRCWSDGEVMLCALFSNGKLFALSFEAGTNLPPRALRALRGPDGKQPLPPGPVLERKLESTLFLSRLATESGITVGTPERELLGVLGSPHEVVGVTPPYKLVYYSKKAKDPKCPNYCSAAFTLSGGKVVTIFLSVEP